MDQIQKEMQEWSHLGRRHLRCRRKRKEISRHLSCLSLSFRRKILEGKEQYKPWAGSEGVGSLIQISSTKMPVTRDHKKRKASLGIKLLIRKEKATHSFCWDSQTRHGIDETRHGQDRQYCKIHVCDLSSSYACLYQAETEQINITKRLRKVLTVIS